MNIKRSGFHPAAHTNHSTPPEPDPPTVAADPAKAVPVRTPSPAAPRVMAADQPVDWDTVTEAGARRRFPDPPLTHPSTLARRLTP